MGASSSHHKPLDRSKRVGSFKRAASLRMSKSKASKTSPRRMDKLRRSFRDSFRRRKETTATTTTTLSEASKPHLWQTDEMDVRTGTCFFHVKYLGCVEVFESRGMQVCEEALKVLKNNHRRRSIKAILYVSGDGLRVVEDDTKGLIVDQTIEKVSFCAPDRSHDRGFSYICRDGTTRRWMCHGFLALKESGERLSHAVGCAFAVCLERKQKRDKECKVTMDFDISSSTFTRTGSFKQPSLTDKLQDTTNINNNVNVNTPVTATTSNSPDNSVSTTTVININNNVGVGYHRKENFPTRKTTKMSTHAIERPHATVSMLQRQNSFRGLSHLNHASPFKRQLSLRISDLPSNVERTRSHSLEFPNSQAPKTKTPVSPISEASHGYSYESNQKVNTNDVTEQALSAVCKEFSHGLSLLSNYDDLFFAKNNQPNSMFSAPVAVTSETIAQKTANCSTRLDGQLVSSPNSYLFRKLDASNTEHDHSLLETMNESCPRKIEVNAVDPNVAMLNEANCEIPRPLSCISSVGNSRIPPTPPETPPLASGDQLPKPEQWLGKVTQLTMNSSESPSAVVLSSSISPPAAKRAPALSLHTKAYSLSSAENVISRANEKSNDPFNIDWVSLAAETAAKPPNKNTNPFVASSPPRPTTSDRPIKTFEVQM